MAASRSFSSKTASGGGEAGRSSGGGFGHWEALLVTGVSWFVKLDRNRQWVGEESEDELLREIKGKVGFC
jgi:hypothetical protein